MSNAVVVISYLVSMSVALFLLWRFSHIRWYWHVLAVAVALGLGLMPPLAQEAGRNYDVTLGSAFLFLLVWGAGEPLFKVLHLPRHF